MWYRNYIRRMSNEMLGIEHAFQISEARKGYVYLGCRDLQALAKAQTAWHEIDIRSILDTQDIVDVERVMG